MKLNKTIIIGLISCMQVANTLSAQQGLPFKAKKQFVMPSISKNEYLENTIIFKLKDQYRNISSINDVNHPLLKMVFQAVGANAIAKKFPHHQAPEKNEFRCWCFQSIF
jgi:hypothetical protein